MIDSQADIFNTIQLVAGALFFGGAVVYSKFDHERKRVRVRAKRQSELYKDLKLHLKSRKLDPTKRKSLQPSNQEIKPSGWTQKEETNWQIANTLKKEAKTRVSKPLSEDQKAELPVKLKNVYYHKFFGSQLVVDGIMIIQGLTNRNHNLEIHHTKVFVDGNPISINPGDLERVKYWLSKIQR